MDLVKNEVDQLKMNRAHNQLLYPNMSHDYLQALEELTNNGAITIKQADKGGVVVVWNTVDYIEEAMRQLNDTNVYVPLDRDPKWEITHKIQTTVQKALTDGTIESELIEFLTVAHPKTPQLYLLPKIHKSMHKPPERPIVLGRGSILNNISIFLDRVLTGFVKGTKS